MFCRKCGEENPDNAVFCRNCGTKLTEEVKKAEVIDTPSSTNNQGSSTTTSSSKKDGSNWMGCCLCIIVVFIVFGIFGTIFHL